MDYKNNLKEITVLSPSSCPLISHRHRQFSQRDSLPFHTNVFKHFFMCVHEMPEFPSAFSKTSFFFQVLVAQYKDVQIIPMYFCESFFFPKALYFNQQTIYSLLAHTKLLKSFALVFFLIILLYPTVPSACSRKKVALQTISAKLL